MGEELDKKSGAAEGGAAGEVRDRLIGLGSGSIRKSYYPELRQRLDELDRMHGYLASVLDAMPSAILGVDADLRVTRANRAAADLAGLPRAEMEGRLLGDIFPDLRRYLAGATRAVAQGQPLERRAAEAEGPAPGPCASGNCGSREPRYYDIMVAPIEAGRSAVIRLDDVTDRVRLDQLIVQTEKMVSLGGLAAGMAHEINNPLGGILQGAQNILLRLDPARPANVQAAREAGCSLDAIHDYARRRGILRFLDGIRASGRRAASIVQHMLEFSRASDTRHEPHHLERVVEGALALAASDFGLDRKAGFRRVAVQRDFREGVPPVLMSRTEIEQVVFNLVKNAVEAMGEAGTAQPRLVFSTRVEGGFAVLEVADNGPGMDEATRRRVFEPFFTTKEVGKGTGLGLSVSYFIVTTNHGGEFAVDSRPGRGSRFVIRLPL
ncbi:two-component system sensor histidine kinase NtrB [Desulfocurvus vexinensis]|uniref:two-component system sensor histidine kinase NtrB n=1 Tax=Desulfocurvus vexinensis TaxID=399548 RepID=UPI00068850C8|nr:ATP-binding protein [Desulfocurvus vexinensis]